MNRERKGHLVSIGHPNGEEVPDDRVPDALPSEVDPSVLQFTPSRTTRLVIGILRTWGSTYKDGEIKMPANL